jgi:hypothetical protein
MKKLTVLILATISLNAFSFDLVDYQGTYTQTRDAYKNAYNSWYLAEQSYIGVLEDYKLVAFMNPAGYSKSGLELNSCAHLKSCKEARASSKVLPKVATIGADARVSSYVTPGEISRLSGEISDYYSKFDDSLTTGQEVLFEEQSSSVAYLELGTDGSRYGITTWSGSGDIEDLYTTFRMRRDAYLSATNQLKLARPPYEAARAGFAAALENYFNYYNCSGWGPGKSIDELVDNGDI